MQNFGKEALREERGIVKWSETVQIRVLYHVVMNTEITLRFHKT